MTYLCDRCGKVLSTDGIMSEPARWIAKTEHGPSRRVTVERLVCRECEAKGDEECG